MLDAEGKRVGSTAPPAATANTSFSLFTGLERLGSHERMAMFLELLGAENDLLGFLLSIEDPDRAVELLEIDERLDSDDSNTLEPEDLEGLSRQERAEVAVRMSQAIENGVLDLGMRAKALAQQVLEIRRRLFADSLRLVIKQSTMRGELLDFSTAILQGAIGLDKAIDRFDPGRGYQFSTYASWWVRHQIQRSRHDYSRAIRAPVHASEQTGRYFKAQQDLWAKTGIKPSAQQVLDQVEAEMYSAEKLAEYRRTTWPARPGGHPPFGLAEFIVDPDLPTPLDGCPSTEWAPRAFECLEQHLVHQPYGRLTKQAAKKFEVFRSRLAIGLPKAPPLRELGESMDLSRERIRQLETQVLVMLRTRLYRTAEFVSPWSWTPPNG